MLRISNLSQSKLCDDMSHKLQPNKTAPFVFVINIQHLEHSCHSSAPISGLLSVSGSRTCHVREIVLLSLYLLLRGTVIHMRRELRGRSSWRANFASLFPAGFSRLQVHWVPLIWSLRRFWRSCTMCSPASPRRALNPYSGSAAGTGESAAS